MVTAAELVAMRRAIALSALGLGTTSPNPPVGCVILDAAGNVVGEGHHERKGEPHAEVYALAAAGERASGGTAVVTLEPCNHYGRTPPCHQALIDARIARVVVATIDPTSRGEGGVARLRQAGVDVEVEVLAEEARLVLDPWLSGLRTSRPHVTWSYLAMAGDSVEALSTLTDAQALRRTVDVVLHDDGSVQEAIPNSHGVGALSLTNDFNTADPEAGLHALYQSGVRAVLLDGGAELARRLLAHRLVDRVVVYVSATQPASRVPQTESSPFLPVGFRLVALTWREGFLRVETVARDEGGLN